MRYINSNFLIALLGGSALVALVAWAMFWRIEEVQVEEPDDKPPVVSRSVDMIGRRDGQERWRLISEEVQLVDGQQVFDQGAHGLFYGDPKGTEPTSETEEDPFFANQDQMEWDAGKARYDAISDLLYLDEDVNVRDPDGSHLITESLHVTPEKLMDVPTPFTLASDDMVLSGSAGAFNFEFALMTAEQGKLIVLEDPSALTVQAQPGQPGAAYAATLVSEAEQDPDATIITADELTYDRETKVANGQGNLVIAEKGLEIKAPQGTYDRRAAESRLDGGVVLRELEGGTSEDTVLADLSLPNVGDGQDFQEDQPVTIVADQLNYDRNNQVAQGEGNLEIQQGETVIEAPQGSYRRRESQSILVGGVVLREPERVLASERLEGNHKDKIFLFEEGVSFTQEPSQDDESPSKIEIQAEQLVYNSPSEVSEFTENVRFVQEPQAVATAEDPEGPLTDQIRQERTEVKAARLTHNSQTEESEFFEDVELIQEARKANAEQIKITPETIFLTGDVEIQQIDGNWLAQEFEDPDVQDDIARPTLIFADRVEIDQATSDAQFFDNVVIVQANRAAEGDTATYLDGDQVFKLSANSEAAPVLLCDRNNEIDAVAPDSIEGLPGRDALDVTCRGADKIRSKLITLDMENDTFEALGQSVMEFSVSADEAL